MDQKKPLVIIAGPTASGKTSASVALAKEIGGEVISADSAQVYRYMDIGSAKIRPEEMEGVPHHLIDVLDPKEEFNVYVFQKLAREAMDGIYERGRIPIICGGTGFYIQSVLRDVSFEENDGDRTYRKMLEERLLLPDGIEENYRLLQEIDPKAAASMHKNNAKRVIRALEYFHETGEQISVHNARESEKESPFDYRYFVLEMDRAHLYSRIDARVDLMMKEGLLQEVERLLSYGCTRDMVSMRALGYQQIAAHLAGECSLSEAVERIKLETRHFAKRQLTWFRHEKNTIPVEIEKENIIDVYSTWHF